MAEYFSRILYIISDKKSKLLLLVTAFLAISLLDTVGIGLIGPFMGLATSPNIIFENKLLNHIYTQLGFTSRSQFIVLIGAVIVFIFYLKSFLNFWMQGFIFKFSFSQAGALVKRLLSAYLAVDYTFHLKRNSAVLIQTLIVETEAFSNRVLIPLLVSISNTAVLSFLLLLLTFTSPVGTLSIIGIILVTFTIVSRFKGRMACWGQRASESQSEMIRIINHSLGGLKETRVIGCEPFFTRQIEIQTKQYANSMGSILVFGNLPRILIEAFLITFLIGFTALFLTFNQNPQNLTSVLSVFAIASIRMLPAASAVVGAYTNLRTNKYVIDKLYFDIKETEKSIETLSYSGSSSNGKVFPYNYYEDVGSDRLMPFTKQITLDKVAYRYPGAETQSLQGVSLTIRKGESIALIGKSGAGKTTLVDVILGLLRADSGEIAVDGVSIYKNLRSWQNLIGYIPQSIFLLDDSIKRNIAFGVPDEQIDYQRLNSAIESAQLSSLMSELPDGFDTYIGERGVRLSGGQRQRIGIARALYHEREILVLDEATSALDSETEKYVTDAIKSLAGTKTLIIIAHRLTTIEHCDRVYLMEQGRIVQSGTYQEVVEKNGEKKISSPKS